MQRLVALTCVVLLHSGSGTEIEKQRGMNTLFRTNDPQAARRYFEAKVNFSTGPGELHTALEHGRRVGVDFILIDVRDGSEFDKGHIPGATNLPETRWATFEGLATDKLNLLYGDTPESRLAARAAVEFARAGYPVMEIDGGYRAWSEDYDYPVETKPNSAPGLKRSNDEGRYTNESML